MNGEWPFGAEACTRTGANPDSFIQPELFTDSNTKLFIETKKRVKDTVEEFYGFETMVLYSSESSETDPVLERCCLTCLLSTLFAHHPYRHPAIQAAFNVIWFRNSAGDGVVYHEQFSPVPVPAIAFVLTVVECCIDEWAGGLHQETGWDDERFKTVYRSHISSLGDFQRHAIGDMLEHIQSDLLKEARQAVSVTGIGPFVWHPEGMDGLLPGARNEHRGPRDGGVTKKGPEEGGHEARSKDIRTDEERAALLAWADDITACNPYKPELEELELSPPGDTRNAPSSPEGPPMAIECPVVNAQLQQVQAQLAALLAVVAGGDGTSVAPFLAAVVGGPALTPDTVTATDGHPPTSSGERPPTLQYNGGDLNSPPDPPFLTSRFLCPGRGRIGQIVL
ncbi:hypothetical protein EDB89DRAFT_2070392 [Lactarius sanguifluus]|nr:hypothetical protein EDB89DRAFT_2070392 [Lactarius sanguifluus]